MKSATTFMFLMINKRGFAAPGKRYDLAIVGGGPGGYTTAIKAAQNGLKVACIDRRSTLGGTCLNVGCIPSKSLLNASHNYHIVKSGLDELNAQVPGANLTRIMDNKTKILNQLNMGIMGLFKKNGIDFIHGNASLVSATEIAVEGHGSIESKNIILAPGSEVTPFAGDLPVDGVRIIVSDDALSLKSVPEKLIVIGGGAIGLELASVYNRLGSKVVVLEYADVLCSVMDIDVSNKIKKILEKQGIEIRTGAKVLNGKGIADGVEINAQGMETLHADVALLAMGRRPYTKDLGLEKLDIAVENGRIVVNDQFCVPNYPNIQAIGDAIMGPMLAHKAEEDGMVALGHLLNKTIGHKDYGAIPSVIYTDPEIAGVG
ncbi:bifunctional FAD-NAD(P)-binding domain/FAD-NAD(P)-binding domain superfamily/Pyridine nucleotide-disulfide oxidoreductase, partial [Babesia duncani]